MKRLLFLILVLFSINLNAKPARYYYYCFTQNHESVSNDDFISVEYELDDNFKTYTKPDVATTDFAHPVLHIVVKNHSQDNIILYTDASTFSRNSFEVSLSEVGPWSNEVSIPAGESRSFAVEIITAEGLHAINTLFSIIQAPVYKELIPSGKQLGIQVGEYKSYNEAESLLKLASQIIYAVEGGSDKYSVLTSYYLNTVVGMPINGLGVPKYDELAVIFPDSMSDKFETFILINTKK